VVADAVRERRFGSDDGEIDGLGVRPLGERAAVVGRDGKRSGEACGTAVADRDPALRFRRIARQHVEQGVLAAAVPHDEESHVSPRVSNARRLRRARRN